MQQFLKRHKKLLSISLSIVSSVFLVALVVTAATTIGANITTGGNITPSTNNASDLGSNSVAWKDVYVTGTIYSGPIIAIHDYLSVGAGAVSSTIRKGASATSTFGSGMEFNEASATTTLSVGHERASATTKGQGGCLAIGSTSSTPAGADYLYVYVGSMGDGTLYLATSTSAKACY